MTKIVVGVVVYSYRADGLHVLRPRKLGTLRPQEEVISYETLTNKERKRRKAAEAVKRAQAQRELSKRIVR